MNGCTDYGALAGVTNYAKLLARGGCTHTDSIPGGVLPGPEVLGETSPGLRRSLRNFIGYFWALFGRPAARRLAEEKRAKVFVVFVVVLSLFLAKLRWILLFCASDIVACFLTGGAEGSGEQASADSELGDCGRCLRLC